MKFLSMCETFIKLLKYIRKVSKEGERKKRQERSPYLFLSVLFLNSAANPELILPRESTLK